MAARVLRRILVEYARAHNRLKRGAGAERIPLEEAEADGLSLDTPAILLQLDEALDRLGRYDRRKAEIIQLLFFGGLTYDETAAALNISPATVHRELKLARAWLYREMAPGRVQRRG